MKPYQIPGFEDVGTPGSRKPTDTKKLEEILKPYLEGNGVVFTPYGQVTTQDQTPNSSQLASLSNTPLSF